MPRSATNVITVAPAEPFVAPPQLVQANNILSLSQIDAKIRGIGQSAKNLRESSQDVAIAVMRHCVGEGRGDCTRALRLVKALPKRLQSQMTTFFKAFSPIRVTIGKTADKDSCRLAKPTDKSFTDWNIDGALAVNWQDFNKEPKPKKAHSLNSFRTELQNLLKRYQRLADADEAEQAADILGDIVAFRAAALERGRAVPTPVAGADTQDLPF